MRNSSESAAVAKPLFGGLGPEPQQLRAVFATEFWYGSSGSDLAHGLRSQGWDIDQIHLNHFALSTSSFASKITSRLLQPVTEFLYNDKILNAVKNFDPSIFVTVKGGYIQKKTLEYLRDRNILRVNFYPDVEFSHPSLDEDIVQYYDLILTTKSFHLSYLINKIGSDRVAFVPHGFSSSIQANSRTGQSAEPMLDISYIGNASPKKFETMLKLATQIENLKMLVVGERWAEFAAGTPLEPFVLGYGLAGDFMREIVLRSRINIAIHAGSKRPGGWEDLVSRRSFEIPAYGGFMLHVDNEEIRELYDVPSEIDVFHDDESLLRQVKHYLANPEERMAMAARAGQRAVPAYSTDSRAVLVDSHIRTKLNQRAAQNA